MQHSTASALAALLLVACSDASDTAAPVTTPLSSGGAAGAGATAGSGGASGNTPGGTGGAAGTSATGGLGGATAGSGGNASGAGGTTSSGGNAGNAGDAGNAGNAGATSNGGAAGTTSAGGNGGASDACAPFGAPGTCLMVSDCSALGDHSSYPGYCAGPSDIQCCIVTPSVADDPPTPSGWVLMQQSQVTADMTTWAVMILDDPATYPMFSTTIKTFGALMVLARVEWHPPDFQNGVVHRGVTLYVPM